MKSKKRRRWRLVAIALLVLVVMGGAGLYAFDYAVNRVMNSLVESIDLEEAEWLQPSENTSTDNTTATSPKEETTEGNGSQSGGDSGSSSGGADASRPEHSGDGSTAGSSGAPSSNGGVSSKDEPSGEPNGTYNPEVSVEKAKEIQESVTLAEKTTVASILMSNLSMSDIRQFQKLASGGLTVEEKRVAKKILLEKLSPEEYDKLIAIAKKYGISKGKTYQDSIKEFEQTQ
jgi:hypothetical protein